MSANVLRKHNCLVGVLHTQPQTLVPTSLPYLGDLSFMNSAIYCNTLIFFGITMGRNVFSPDSNKQAILCASTWNGFWDTVLYFPRLPWGLTSLLCSSLQATRTTLGSVSRVQILYLYNQFALSSSAIVPPSGVAAVSLRTIQEFVQTLLPSLLPSLLFFIPLPILFRLILLGL
jgi:hypothetical protein